jgi:putative restriction endonuclease
MAKAIFTAKPRSIYDDLPEVRYHFPATYLNAVQTAVGDRIIYYEPRRQDNDLSGREGRQAYFATARVVRVEPDGRRAGHYYAYVDDYLDFDFPVSFREGDSFYESKLRKPDGSTNKGAFGRAVRFIRDDEFDLICRAGFAPVISVDDRSAVTGLAEEPARFDRPIVEQLLRRPFRDAAFALNVRRAYNDTCALTGLRMINGGGRPEMEAAHIRPVAEGHGGTDSVRNGIALCRTVHWMFDRGLVSLNDDYTILVDRKHVPGAVRRMLRPDLQAAVPQDPVARPHPQFLRYHREHIYKGD